MSPTGLQSRTCRGVALLYSANNFFNAAFSSSRVYVYNALNHTVRQNKLQYHNATRESTGRISDVYAFFFCRIRYCVFFPWLCQHSGRHTQQLTFCAPDDLGRAISPPRRKPKNQFTRESVWVACTCERDTRYLSAKYPGIFRITTNRPSPSQWVSMYLEENLQRHY